jgi:hypothetical protein
MMAELHRRWRQGVLRRRKAYILARYAEELHRNLLLVAMPMDFQRRYPHMTFEEARSAATKLARMTLVRLDFELRAAEHDKRIVRVKVKV